MLILKNFKQLARTPARKKALAVLEAGYQAINLKNALRDKLRIKGGNLQISGKNLDLKRYRQVAVVGIGKCSLEAAQYLEKILGGYLTTGLVLDTRTAPLKKIKSRQFKSHSKNPDSHRFVEPVPGPVDFYRFRRRLQYVFFASRNYGEKLYCPDS